VHTVNWYPQRKRKNVGLPETIVAGEKKPSRKKRHLGKKLVDREVVVGKEKGGKKTGQPRTTRVGTKNVWVV